MRVRIPTRAFNRVYLPLLEDDTHRYLVLCGGAGSGKSMFAAQRLLIRLMGKPRCNLLVARAVMATHRDSTYALMKQLAGVWGIEGLFKFSDMRISCLNGNSVIFKGLDDPEKLKSVTFPNGELTDIWIEEASELTEAQFNQLDLRLRGRGVHKQMTLTFNPVSSFHWLKRRFFDRNDPRAWVLRTTYKDNRFLDEDYIATLEGYRDSDPYYYQVYCLGEWGVMGQTYFHRERLARRLNELSLPKRTGEFNYSVRASKEDGRPLIDSGSIRLIDTPSGFVRVYEEPLPDKRYVIGGDTAGEGSDYFVAQVLEAESGKQVCVLRGRMDEDLYARQVYCLGCWYNWAHTAIECNFSGYPLRELDRLGYPSQYLREDGGLGFRTTSVTRPLILGGLVKLVRERTELLCDLDTIRELLTFVRSSRGRPEAQSGCHDDCVMALAIANYVRGELEMEEQVVSCAVRREFAGDCPP